MKIIKLIVAVILVIIDVILIEFATKNIDPNDFSYQLWFVYLIMSKIYWLIILGAPMILIGEIAGENNIGNNDNLAIPGCVFSFLGFIFLLVVLGIGIYLTLSPLK